MATGNEKNKPVFGTILILLGAYIFMESLNLIYFEFEDVWPMIPTVIAAMCWFAYAKNPKDYEQLMPAAILTVYSAMFWLVSFNRSFYMDELWPLFILGPALGLWLMQLSSFRKKDYRTSAIITTLVGLFFLMNTLDFIDGPAFIGLLLMGIGVTVMLKKSEKTSEDYHTVDS